MARGMALKRNAFWAAAILLVWNLIGVAAFVGQATMNLNDMAKVDAYQARMFATMPGWAWAAYAVAVIAGTLGTIALIFRSGWAVPLYWLSLIGVVVQFGRTFLMTDLIEVRGWWTAIFPAFIALVALVQLWFAISLKRDRHLA